MRFLLPILTILFCGLAIFTSCGPGKSKSGPPVKDSSAPVDTRRKQTDSSKENPSDRQSYKQFDPGDYHVYVTRRMSHYLITFLNYKDLPYTGPDGKLPSERAIMAQNVLLLKDTLSGRQDTLVTDISSVGEKEYLEVKDLTMDLKFKQLVFQLNWQGEDDNIFCEVIGFKGDTLAKLFRVPTASSLDDLKRNIR